MTVRELDCRNLRCPMPIVQLALAIRTMQIGDELTVAATDPAFLADVKAWSRLSGQLIDSLTDGDVKQARIRKVK